MNIYLEVKKLIKDVYKIKNRLRKEDDFFSIPIFNSYKEALEKLGENKKFRYSKNNLDGVFSPKDNTVKTT